MHRALRLGITGKIGSGKSTLSGYLRRRGIEVMESDIIAKDIMTRDQVVRGEIRALLGDGAYDGETLNRDYIARAIFSDPSKRVALESIVHPRVTVAMNLRFEAAKAGVIVGLESALILQTELWRQFDYIINVEASDDAVVERAALGGRFDAEDLQARLREQSEAAKATDEIDFTITNDSTLESFEKRCEFIIAILPALASRDLPPEPLHQVELDLGDEPSEN